ncbi:hypothetical protein TIFTF001_030535 [Ficus carica]|uniref:Uncharacterized protein n=1 Tax=Ficus carica TaxID=3494 RepID=A0AA88DTL4_FICCA|nr:hypothetical protein TIFTF001_030535 [Ficus carica]
MASVMAGGEIVGSESGGERKGRRRMINMQKCSHVSLGPNLLPSFSWPMTLGPCLQQKLARAASAPADQLLCLLVYPKYPADLPTVRQISWVITPKLLHQA